MEEIKQEQSVMEKAEEMAKRIEEANKRAEELIKKSEEVYSRAILSGKGSVVQELPKVDPAQVEKDRINKILAAMGRKI